VVFRFDYFVHLFAQFGLARDGRAEGRHCEAVFWRGGGVGVMVFAGADGEGAVHSGEGCQMGCRGHFGIEYEDMGEDRVGDEVNLKKLGGEESAREIVECCVKFGEKSPKTLTWLFKL
jgi:hypothetical protein